MGISPMGCFLFLTRADAVKTIAAEAAAGRLDPSKLTELGWAPRQSLENGLQVTYDYIAKERETA